MFRGRGLSLVFPAGHDRRIKDGAGLSVDRRAKTSETLEPMTNFTFKCKTVRLISRPARKPEDSSNVLGLFSIFAGHGFASSSVCSCRGFAERVMRVSPPFTRHFRFERGPLRSSVSSVSPRRHLTLA